MQELNAFFQENLTRELISGIFSNPKSDKTFRKIRIRPLEKNKSLYFQFEQFTDTQVFHENLSENEALAKAYISTQLSNSIVFAVLIIVLLVRPVGLLGKKISEKV